MSRRPFLPLSLNLEERPVVVIGGGKVAARKVATFLRYGARVTVIAPRFCEELVGQVSSALELREKRYDASDLVDGALVVAATDDRELNRRVHAEAKSRGALVNVSDDAALCDFTLPAIVDREGIQIGVATSGNPALTRLVRDHVERSVGPEFTTLQQILGDLRDAVKAAIASEEARARFFRDVASEESLGAFREGDEAGREYIRTLCAARGIPLPDSLRR